MEHILTVPVRLRELLKYSMRTVEGDKTQVNKQRGAALTTDRVHRYSATAICNKLRVDFCFFKER